MNKQEIIQRILIVFTTTLAVACIGIYMGQYIPKQWMLPLMIIEIIINGSCCSFTTKEPSRVYILIFICGNFWNNHVSSNLLLCK